MEKATIFPTVWCAVAMLLFAWPSWSAESKVESVDFANMSSAKVLLIYQELAHCELVQSSEVSDHHRDISLRGSGSKGEVLKLIETALIEQAAIVITRVDDKRVSVTFNNALPITPVKRPNPVNVKITR